MIDPNIYSLTSEEHAAIDQLLTVVGRSPSLVNLWQAMDLAWRDCNCNNLQINSEQLEAFYNHPIWLLNGMFIEQHDLSMGHRQAIADAVSGLYPKQVLDFGGGFGTLARLLAAALPDAKIAICDPYPPRHGIESCKPYNNIRFVPELSCQSVDVLVSTDVLEHVPDPLALLVAMVDAVRPGGHLLIANCFYPVILCHLPCTFHLRYTFNDFCRALGLEILGLCEGSHATIYRRSNVVVPDWPRLRAMERRSQRLLPWRDWRASHLSPWWQRGRLAVAHPLLYPRKLVRALWSLK